MTKPKQAIPIYKRVKQHILERIASGVWGPDEQIPTESELVEMFEASRMTINRAMRELTDEGFLSRTAGVGTFVADRRTHAHPLEIRNVAEDVRARGNRYHAVVAELTQVTADEQLAAQFGVLAGFKLFRSVLVHYENDIAIQLEDRFVNPVIAPDYLRNDFGETTPEEYLMGVAPLQSAEHVLRAVMPNSLSHRLLSVPTVEPCLLIVRRTWSSGIVASYAEICHPGSRYELSARFIPENQRGSVAQLKVVDSVGSRKNPTNK